MNAPNDNFQESIEIIQSELVTGEDEAKTEKIGVEEFSIKGDALGAKIKELIHQGNIRRIILKNEEGHILIEIPLTVGVVGGAILQRRRYANGAAFFKGFGCCRLDWGDGCSSNDRGRKTSVI